MAEAEIPYDKLVEMDDINHDLPQADVVLVIGANDVVNPAARHDKSSPIFGMPIIDADKARTCFAIKRSMNPGFAGIENELYYGDRTYMLFGDAKAVVGELVKAAQRRQRTLAGTRILFRFRLLFCHLLDLSKQVPADFAVLPGAGVAVFVKHDARSEGA